MNVAARGHQRIDKVDVEVVFLPSGIRNPCFCSHWCLPYYFKVQRLCPKSVVLVRLCLFLHSGKKIF